MIDVRDPILDSPGPPDSPTPPGVPSGHMTLWEHIAELRTRLIRICFAIAVGVVAGWVVYPYLLAFLREPLADLAGNRNFIATDPLEPFATRIKISAYSGIVIAMPVILWQIWRFVTPGLHKHEKRYALPFVTAASVLFALGAAIAYLTLNPALQFLIGIGGGQIDAYYTVDSYVTLIAFMMLAFGAGFEFPVLLVALQMVGVLTPRKLLSWWRQAIVIIAVVAAVITPSGDPISMLALAIPMVIFYFAAIVVGFVLARRKRTKARKAAATAA
jgi:sec-independent protein translocase protein TatC